MPCSSIKAKRSTSGSTAIPKSACEETTVSDKSVKCCFSGSGLCGNCPFGSQCILTASTPKRSKSKGITIPPVELTASTTTLNLQSEIAFTFTNSKSSTSSI